MAQECPALTLQGVSCYNNILAFMIFLLGNQTNLQGGTGPNEGNIYVDGIPICPGGFGWDEADVVCKELGYNHTLSFFTNSHFGQIPDWFLNSWTNFGCRGTETALGNCSHAEDGECGKDSGVGVVCSHSDEGNKE